MNLHGDQSANGIDRFDPDRSKTVLNQEMYFCNNARHGAGRAARCKA